MAPTANPVRPPYPRNLGRNLASKAKNNFLAEPKYLRKAAEIARLTARGLCCVFAWLYFLGSMATELFALFLGFAFTYVGRTYSALSRRMRSFKSVPGKVVAREVVVVPSGNTREGHWGEGGGYTPQVTYRYVVDGVEHQSNRFGHAIRGYKRAIAERKLAEIPEQVVVWYDPSKPSEAYLQRHGTALGYAIWTLGMALIAGSVIGLLN